MSTSLSVSSRSNRLGGSRWMHHGWCCRKLGGPMKINLPIFKDEDTKDAVTYQIWHWDLPVYCYAGCWDCTLLPYAICFLQGYLGELVRSSGKDITLDDVLTILDKHYNNVKALDALSQELFQMWMGEKESVLDWGCIGQGISKSLWHHSQNASHQTASPSWSVIALMESCLRGLRQW